MALCPQCDHSILVHTLLTDGLAGYSCGKCLGTLVSLVSYRAWRATSAPHVSDPKATRSKNSWPSYAERRIMPHDGGESLDSLVDHFAPIDLQLLRANERARGARQA